MSERGQAAHMLEARERRQAHRLHSDPLAKSHHSSLTCAFVSQVYPSFNPPPTICAFCHVSVVQMGKTVATDILYLVYSNMQHEESLSDYFFTSRRTGWKGSVFCTAIKGV